MVKLEQALILEPPHELHFKAPFRDVTTSYLKLTNPTEQSICFKLKTTAPKTYCVRPNSGVIPPKENVSVAVMLQPIDVDTADKSKHKFMVQSMYVPDGEVNIEALFRNTLPEKCMNSKLKCVFDLPDQNLQATVDSDSSAQQEAGNASDVSNEVPIKESHVSSEISKIYDDNRQLKAVLAELKQENSHLKEESLRWRVTRGGGKSEIQTSSTPGSSVTSRATRSMYAQPEQSIFCLKNLVVVTVALVISIYLGTRF